MISYISMSPPLSIPPNKYINIQSPIWLLDPGSFGLGAAFWCRRGHIFLLYYTSAFITQHKRLIPSLRLSPRSLRISYSHAFRQPPTVENLSKFPLFLFKYPVSVFFQFPLSAFKTWRVDSKRAIVVYRHFWRKCSIYTIVVQLQLLLWALYVILMLRKAISGKGQRR